LTTIFSPSLVNRRIQIKDLGFLIPDSHFEDLDPNLKLIILDPEHWLIASYMLSCAPSPHQVSQEDVKKILANFDNSEALALSGVSVAGTK